MLGHVIGAYLHRRAVRRIARIARRGAEADLWQARALLRHVRRAAGTRFGRAHRFDDIRTVAEYRARVPLQDYAALKPYLDRARDGAKDETWPGRPVAFAMTSGTTAGNKFLPVTKASLRSQLRASSAGMAAYLARAGDRRLTRGRVAFLGGSATLERFDSGLRWGDLTGILSRRTPLWSRLLTVPPRAVLSLADWEERIEAAGRDLARRDVRVLLGFPSWSLLLLDAVEHAAGRPIAEAWPHWRGFIHSGMAFGPYADIYRSRGGPDLVCVETYASTEGGVMAVQDRGDDPALALVCDRDVFFDLVPAEDLGAPEPRRVGVHEAEPGVPYAIAVTTNAGLWSFLVGDLVRFTSNRPPRLLFHGRSSFFLNAFGEHVAQHELEDAAARAATATGCSVVEFAVVPEYPGDGRSAGRHRWLVECEPPPRDAAAFARAADEHLMACNLDYRAHRAGDVQLLPPALRLLPPGTFHAWMKARDRFGGQHKVPRVLDEEQAASLLA